MTFDMDNKSDLIIQFPLFVQTHNQSPLTLHITEVVPCSRLNIHILIHIQKSDFKAQNIPQ